MTQTSTKLPSLQARIIGAIFIGTISAALSYWLHLSIDQTLTDIPWAINAARDLVHHADPYRHDYSTGLIPYPLTAAIVTFFFAMLPGSLSLAVFTGLACGLVAFGLTRDGEYWRLLLFISPSYIMAIHTGQWSPVFVAAYLFPALLPVVTAKPTLALPVLFSSRWRWTSGIGIVAVIGLSLLIMPDWPWRWLSQTGRYEGFIPLLSPLGPFLLLSLLVWRRPPARLLFLMSISIQHQLFYDQLLLWLTPQSFRQMLVLTIPSWVVFLYVRAVYITFWGSGPFILAGIYLPALLIVLWQSRAELRLLANRFRLPVNLRGN
ncbi:MAG: hypothetical protein HGA19_19030 [Oscillochloris sp.]|nr:hypothetical protein [Oscillochloris sp.]